VNWIDNLFDNCDHACTGDILALADLGKDQAK
jgi:hypothetical protein